MIWTIIEVSATMFDCFIFVEFVSRYLGWKIKNIKSYIGFGLTFLILILATFVMNHITLFEGAGGLIYSFILVIYGALFLNGSIYEKVVIASIINGLKMTTVIAVFALYNNISNYQITELITREGMIRLMLILVDKSIFLFFTRLILRMQKKNKFSLSTIEWIAIFGVFIMSFITGVLVFEMIMINPKTWLNDWLAVLVVVSLILINILCYYIFVNTSAKNKEKLQYSLKELQLAEQQKNLKEMKLSYEEVRKLRHDMKNYVECAVTLLHNDKFQEAKNYLENLLNNKISFGSQIVFTESDAINAVINSKISLCRKHKIKFNYQISGNIKAVSELDLSILLGNLLDNAIEACMKIDNGEINLKIYEDRNYLIIFVNNSIKESVLAKNPKLKSTKREKYKHGLGTLSIKDIVNQYNGMMKYYEKNNHFIFDVWLQITN